MDAYSRAGRIFEAIGYFPAGFGFVLIDVRYRGLDIFPDFVGYLCLAAGLTRLPIRNAAFRWARALALVLIFLSIPGVVWFERPKRVDAEFPRAKAQPIEVEKMAHVLALVGLGAASELLGLAMAWCLLAGVIAEARRLGRTDLSSAAAGHRTVLVGFYLVMLGYLAYWHAVHWLRIPDPPRLVTAGVLAGTTVLSVCVAWKTVVLMRRAARELSATGGDDQNGQAPA